jgi:hypothetical protein
VYTERGLDSAQVEALKHAVDLASENVQAYFGMLRSSPLIVFCHTAECKLALGASPGAAPSKDLGFANARVPLDDWTMAPSAVVVTGPGEPTARILTHELVHAEMKAWIAYDALPTWFNEGTATFIASEPVCPAGPRASPGLDVARLRTTAKWQRHLVETGKTLETYCASSRKVGTWLSRYDTDRQRAHALRELMMGVKGGTSFDAAFELLNPAAP